MDWYSESKEPYYVRIIKDILAKIEDGTWPVRHKLPSEDQLQKEYDVSRGTVRRALSELESAGYIARRPGKGTFVTRVVPKLEKSLGAIESFTEQLSRAGLEARTEVLDRQVIKAIEAEGRVQEAFGIPDDAEVIHIRRLKLGDGTPFAIQSTYFLPDRTPGILEEDLDHLFQLYQGQYQRTIKSADEVLRVRGADEEEARLLDIEPGQPVMVRDRVSLDQKNEPFEVLHSVDHGERFIYRYQILSEQTNIPPVA
jgi:GntR family transcriptional regulator